MSGYFQSLVRKELGRFASSCLRAPSLVVRTGVLFLGWGVVVFGCFWSNNAARAAIVGVEYYDLTQSVFAAQGHGGPLWRGFVDTTANTLTIESWRELPGSGVPFWSPARSSLPLVWPAVGPGGVAFDVPDTFLGQIDGSFAFVSPVSVQDMAWEIQLTETTFTTDVFEGPVVVYPGWGGFAFDNPLTKTKVFSLTADETSMPWLPVDSHGDRVANPDIYPNELPETTLLGSVHAIVSVINAQTAAVPEASSFAALGLISLIGGVASWIRKRNSSPLP